MISHFYLKLKKLNLNIKVVNGKLDLKAPKGVLTKELVEEIKKRKEDLIEFINSYKDENEFSKIQSIALQDNYPLSSSQFRLWVLSQFKEGNIAYNSPGLYVFEGELDVASLEYALNAMVDRHESLRTVFKENEEGNVRQFIKKTEDAVFKINCVDLRGHEKKEEELLNLIKTASTTPFDLIAGPLFRVGLYQVSDNKWIFNYVVHHIIIDAWSMDIFIGETLQLYNAKTNGLTNPLAPLNIQYKDYVGWQSEQLNQEGANPDKEYWLNQFEGELPVLNMPSDKKRPAIQTYDGETYVRSIDSGVSKKIKSLISEQGATMFMGMTAVINTLLYRYSGQEDIVIGTPITGREHPDLQNQIGYYGNTLAIRIQFEKENNFIELLEKVKKQILDAHEHQAYPFHLLVEDLNLQRDRSRNPLFDVQVMFGKSEVKKEQEPLGKLKVSEFEEQEELLVTSRFDMVFQFMEDAGNLSLNIQYNTSIFSGALVEHIADHVEQIMASIAKDPSKRISQFKYISDEEQQSILEMSEGPALAYNKDQTILDLFAEQVAEKPDAVAVAFGETTLTYKELDERSNQLANYLLEHYDLQKDDLIGLMVDRSERMFIGIFGILKAGAAYVPIDPEYPSERIAYLIKDAAVKVLITESDYIFDIEFHKGPVFALDIQLDELDTGIEPPKANVQPDDLCYIIYTSGSTGNPKGVMIEHRNLVHSTIPRLNVFNNVSAFLLLSSLAFDSSKAGIFGTLIAGGAVVLPPKTDILNVSAIAEAIIKYKISHVEAVPSYYKFLIEELADKEHFLEQTVVAGEECPIDLVQEHFEIPNLKDCELINEYGPSEGTVWCSFYKYEKDKAFIASIGKPVDNTEVYILNSENELTPAAVTGEICIAGDGLARGYLNQPELTEKKFIPHPFKKGERLYKTGDMGKRHSDGNIEFLGRKDDQIKINGYRVELGEIEHTLRTSPDIENAVVTFNTKNGAKELVAYLIGTENLNIQNLKAYLSQKIPSYAVPSVFVKLDEFPISPNGKIDRKKILSLEGDDLSRGVEYVAPQNEIETKLIEAFEEVLKKNGIGVKEDFFMLGGDSIKSIQIISRLKQKGYSLTLQDIMQYPVIEDLSQKVTSITRNISQEVIEGIVPLGPIQLSFLNSDELEKHHFNQSVLLKSKQAVSADGLKAVFDKIAFHHDALRMIFKKDESGWVQENRGEGASYGFEVVDYKDEVTFRQNCERIQSSINLETGPLFKVVLFKGSKEDRLLLVAHHLIIDGVSWRILFEDMAVLYQQYLVGTELNLPLKTDAFKYWQEQQLEYASSEQLLKEAEYWTSIEAIPVPDLLKDFTSEEKNTFENLLTASFQLDKNTTQDLLTKSYEAYKTEVNDVLITALTLALNEVLAMDKVLIEMEGHGREDIGTDVDVSRTIGWFTTTYPVILYINPEADRIEQLIDVKESLHRIPNKGIGYGILRHIKEYDYRKKPQITFNYLGDFGSDIKTEEEELFTFSGEYKGREMPAGMEKNSLLDVSGLLVNGTLKLTLIYNNNHFLESTMNKLSEAYKRQLEGLINSLVNQENSFLTPVDLTYQGLSIDQLEKLNASL